MCESKRPKSGGKKALYGTEEGWAIYRDNTLPAFPPLRQFFWSYKTHDTQKQFFWFLVICFFFFFWFNNFVKIWAVEINKKTKIKKIQIQNLWTNFFFWERVLFWCRWDFAITQKTQEYGFSFKIKRQANKKQKLCVKEGSVDLRLAWVVLLFVFVFINETILSLQSQFQLWCIALNAFTWTRRFFIIVFFWGIPIIRVEILLLLFFNCTSQKTPKSVEQNKLSIICFYNHSHLRNAHPNAFSLKFR